MEIEDFNKKQNPFPSPSRNSATSRARESSDFSRSTPKYSLPHPSDDSPSAQIPEKRVRTLTVLRLIFASLASAFICGFIAAFALFYSELFPYYSVAFFVVAFALYVFGMLSVSYLIAAGVYIGMNSK